MIYADMQRHTPVDQGHHLKSCQRCCCVIRIYQQRNQSTASHHNFSHKTFRIIHPFHPYRNIEFEVNHVRQIPGELRVFYYNTKGRRSSVPLEWTDIGPMDPFVAVSDGRALFRVEDLLRLVRLIEEVRSASQK